MNNIILQFARQMSEKGEYHEAQIRLMGVTIACLLYFHRQNLLDQFRLRYHRLEQGPIDDAVMNFVFSVDYQWLPDMIERLRNTPGFVQKLDLLLAPGAETEALFHLVHITPAANLTAEAV